MFRKRISLLLISQRNAVLATTYVLSCAFQTFLNQSEYKKSDMVEFKRQVIVDVRQIIAWVKIN